MKKLVLAGLLAALPSVASATVIEFEGLAPNNNATVLSALPYTEAGFSFSTSAANLFAQPAISASTDAPVSGSDSLIVNGGKNVTLTMTRASNPFDVVSALVAEGRTVGATFPFNGSAQLVFTGQQAAGGVVMQSFDMDLFSPANNPGAFELVSLTGFTGLTRLTIQAFGTLAPSAFDVDGFSFSIDSITTRDTVTALSLPASALLLGTGLVALSGGLSRRRQTGH